jgi:hypothetical protein
MIAAIIASKHRRRMPAPRLTRANRIAHEHQARADRGLLLSPQHPR